MFISLFVCVLLSLLFKLRMGYKSTSADKGSSIREAGRATTVQDESGKSLTEEQVILSRWTEYCLEL